jgi:hypothetical protein
VVHDARRLLASLPALWCLVLFAFLNAASAEGPPVPPSDPRSQDECRAYQRQQNQYANDILQRSKDCSARNWKAKSNDFVEFVPTCGGVKISAFRECREAADASWCAFQGVGARYNDCMKKALAAERKPLEDDAAKNEAQRAREAARLLRENCAADSILPKPEACKGLKPSGSGFEDMGK